MALLKSEVILKSVTLLVNNGFEKNQPVIFLGDFKTKHKDLVQTMLPELHVRNKIIQVHCTRSLHCTYMYVFNQKCAFQQMSAITPIFMNTETGNITYWKFMQGRRMAFEGAVSVLFTDDVSDILEFVDVLWERFFTASGVKGGISEDRKQDLIYNNLYYVFVFSKKQSFLQAKSDLEKRITESLNVIAIVMSPPFNITEVRFYCTVNIGLMKSDVIMVAWT